MSFEEINNIIFKNFRGKYGILKIISSSNFSDIYLVKHVFLQDTRVLKLIKKPFDLENIDKLFDEVRIACRLKHENIIDIYDAGLISLTDDDKPDYVYFIMEYIRGGDLNQYINLFINSNIKMPIYWVLTLMKQVSYGLNVLHSSDNPIVHGDLNPNNVLLSFNSQDHVVVKITDFGFSRDLSALDYDFRLCGTIPFISPESFDNEMGTFSDIYSAGIIFYLFLTNHFPYNIDNYEWVDFIEKRPWESSLVKPSEFNPKVSPRLDDIILKCLAVDPEDRYQNALELLNDIDKCFDEFFEDFDKDIIDVSNDVKKALRLAKYENNRDEARKILQKHNLEIMIDNFDIENNESKVFKTLDLNKTI